jgi:hypothetical protein
MKQRMKADERREEVLKIMREAHADPGGREGFTAKKLAKKSGISVVWFHHLVGAEFKAIKSGMEGNRPPPEVVIEELEGEITALRGEIRDVKAKLKVQALGEATEMIRMIELLDAENRILRGVVRELQQRVREAENAPLLVGHLDLGIKS